MPLSFNGNNPEIIIYNGNQVDNVYYNGHLVWTSSPAPTPLTYTYTGTSSSKTITVDGIQYRIITLTSGGTLTFNRQATVDIWACGGGSNGLKASALGNYSGAGPGGAGAYCNEVDNVSITSIGVVIGARNTASGTIISGDTSLTAAGVANSRDGGTGGGGSWVSGNQRARGGYGDGLSKYPFGDTTNFYPHCAGGGGGIYASTLKGGNGGTNGGNGSSATGGATGGNRGGGAGGSTVGSAASFYGSGGGGSGSNNNGGNGYQGVCYIKILESEF